MKTLAQYQPTLQEASGRYFFPKRSVGTLLLSAGLLVSSVAWGLHYPTRKAQEAIAHLAAYNELIAKANTETETAMQRLDGLLASQPERVQNTTRRSVDALRAQLIDGKPIDPTRILSDAAAQQVAYAEAQAVIAASPFKGLEKRQIPLTPEGQAYLAALGVEAPLAQKCSCGSTGSRHACKARRRRWRITWMYGSTVRPQAPLLLHSRKLRRQIPERRTNRPC